METISGSVVVVLFFDEKSSYQIAKIKTASGDITVSGYFPLLSKELEYSFGGEYVNHPKYGRQFKVQTFSRSQENSKEGIINYLSSDLFLGIGEKTATKIVDAFGLDCISKIIENKSILKQIGFSDSKIELFYTELINNKLIEETIIELLKYEITPKMAMKLFNKYGELTTKVVLSNPYRLITEVEGYGFKKADALALRIGFKPNDPIRIRSAIIYVMQLIVRNYGYTFAYFEQLLDTVFDFIKNELVSKDLIKEEIEYLINNNALIQESDKLYQAFIYEAEIELANKIKCLASSDETHFDYQIYEEYLNDICRENGIYYNEMQNKAIYESLANPFVIITGGPGTGKTTVIKGILQMYARFNGLDLRNPSVSKKIALMAPTGRAAKRMYESTHVLAMTIHRHLGYNYEGEFEYDNTNPLTYDLIIIDEASMIDLLLANNLFKAITPQTKVIMVGDLDQLPSVGPGQVLKDLIDSNAFKTIRLEEIHRQAKDSSIIKLADAIRKGELSWDLMDYHDDLAFYRYSGGEIQKHLIELYDSLQKNGFDPLLDIQVLSPMYKGDVGIDELNQKIQNLVNHNTGVNYGTKEFRINDKILQLVNSPELGIMNGDIGIIKDIIKGEEEYLLVDFDSNMVKIPRSLFDNITLAYAISIHKSQGGEFPIVILPITKAHMHMLKRKLLYTAVTRAKSKLFVLGDLDAFKYGINMLDEARQTTLVNRLVNKNVVKINIEGCPFTYLGEIDMENISPYDFMESEDTTK